MHPLWFMCLFARILLIYLILFLNKRYDLLAKIILFIIGGGFLYKGLIGSNNEIQINNVFWHEARIMHSLFYFAAFFYYMKKNIKMVKIILCMDIIFSIGYRYIFNK